MNVVHEKWEKEKRDTQKKIDESKVTWNPLEALNSGCREKKRREGN